MSTTNQSYIKRANDLFVSGKYQQAQAAYEHAGVKLGMNLVKANIWMCQKRLAEAEAGTESIAFRVPSLTQADADKSALQAQLAQTQALAEKYYTALQNLRFEKMDSTNK